ncbi:MAG: uncharacterized protein JWR53_1076 [Glaciihabitans sp.]|nr:uncharacterized protein [Glaciihabitans sp.]
MTDDYLTTPLDATAVENLKAGGLRFVPLAGDDKVTFEAWLQAIGRGFHAPRVPAEEIDGRLEAFAERRMAGVYDDTASDAATPVGTISSWPTDLTVPGHASVLAWAISTVTVSPTHRRRGIARNLMEAELRTASRLGVPVAILTASEATIYERFGFAPAAMAASWKLDVKRIRWTGPVPTGRVHLVESNSIRDGGGFNLLERVRLGLPGQTRFWGILWNRLFEFPGSDDAKHVRVVRYDDAADDLQGLAIYKVVDNDHAPAELQLRYLVAATDDAYAALWRYLLEIDLIGTITTNLSNVVEPFLWQISDARAARKRDEGDHLWVRILDVKAALEARRYSASGTIALEISDTLGFAAGNYLLRVNGDGVGVVTTGEATPDAACLSLSANELAALYLGGTSAFTLARAGRVEEKTPGAAEAFDRAFRSELPPSLNIWF